MRKLLPLLACLPLFAADERMVVIVSIDGFPAYALEDPRLPVPNIRRLMREGMYARRMTVVNPSVTWPNHTSMVTGVPPEKHGVLYNGRLMPGQLPRKVEQWRNKTEYVRAKTLYDAAHEKGMTTAEVDWVAVYDAPTINWSFAEVPKPEAPVVKEMVAAGIVSAKDVEEFRKGNITWRDEVWTQAAIHILTKHRPNLMLYHLLNTDSTHHRYAPKSLAGGSALALADARLGEVLRALEAAKLMDRVTVIVTSDHGFKVVEKAIRAEVALVKAGVPGQIIPEGGTAMVYTSDPVKARAALATVEGVDRVIEPAEYAALGLPTPEQSDQAPQLVLSAKEGYSFSGGNTGEVIVKQTSPTGSHGYLASDPEMDAIFVAWGRGIEKGKVLDRVRTVDIAPTAAQLLGLRMENVVGRSILQ